MGAYSLRSVVAGSTRARARAGTPGRNRRCCQRHGHREWVTGSSSGDIEEHRGQGARGRECPREPIAYPPQSTSSLPHDHTQDFPTSSTQRRPHADLTGPLRHAPGQHRRSPRPRATAPPARTPRRESTKRRSAAVAATSGHGRDTRWPGPCPPTRWRRTRARRGTPGGPHYDRHRVVGEVPLSQDIHRLRIGQQDSCFTSATTPTTVKVGESDPPIWICCPIGSRP